MQLVHKKKERGKNKQTHGFRAQIPHKLHVVKVATISQFQPKASKQRVILAENKQEKMPNSHRWAKSHAAMVRL